jgi:hypothetical protein
MASTVLLLRHSGISFIYNKRSRDPRIVPWGTPQIIFFGEHIIPFTMHYSLHKNETILILYQKYRNLYSFSLTILHDLWNQRHNYVVTRNSQTVDWTTSVSVGSSNIKKASDWQGYNYLKINTSHKENFDVSSEGPTNFPTFLWERLSQ